MIIVSGGVVLPDGSTLPNSEVAITCIKSTECIVGSSIVHKSLEAGVFNFELVNGVFEVSVKGCKTPIMVCEKVEVTANTPAGISLTELLNEHKYVEVPA